MSDQDQADLRMTIARLVQEHQDYDAAIEAMEKTGADILRLTRMKKKKLALKDRINQLRTRVIPDIIA